MSISEATQRNVAFCHNRRIASLKAGCSSHNVANFSVQEPAIESFDPFTECDKNISERMHEDLVGRPSIVFPHKPVSAKTLTRKSSDVCK